MCKIAPAKRVIDLDAAISDARKEIRVIDNRRRQLLRVIRNFTHLKEKRMPSELFEKELSSKEKPRLPAGFGTAQIS